MHIDWKFLFFYFRLGSRKSERFFQSFFLLLKPAYMARIYIKRLTVTVNENEGDGFCFAYIFRARSLMNTFVHKSHGGTVAWSIKSVYLFRADKINGRDDKQCMSS